jgi:hypothetical protein
VSMQRLFRVALVSLVAALSGAALAHHSTAMFEWGKEQTLDGTVDKFDWTQPHTFIWVNVPGRDGKPEQWAFEGMSPSWLGRRGWNSRTLKQGEAVKIAYYPLRDGRKGGFFVRVTLTDGRTLQGLPQRGE